MSVYTPITDAQLQAFLGRYDVGELESFVGINAGIENTNYFVTTTRCELVLTLFETVDAEDLPFFLGLMAHLAQRGVPSPRPVSDRQGAMLQHLNDRPAALVGRLSGASVERPGLVHCRAVGQMLARLHLAAADYGGQRANSRGYRWWLATRDALAGRLDADDARVLDAELAYQGSDRFAGLPRGIVHADLFRDNTMFVGDELTGVIDFYYACNDVFLYDLAVTANDWCSNADGSLNTDKTHALMAAYNEGRELLAIERTAWPVMLRAAALRFWLSRLYDKHFPRPGELTHIKDPDQFKRILLDRAQRTQALGQARDRAR